MRPNVGRSPASPQRADGLKNRAAGFGADAERDATGGSGGRWPGRRSARSLRGIPRALGLSAEPVIAARELAGGDLRDQHRAGVAQLLHHRGVVIKDLILERIRSPRGLVALDRDDVFRAPRNAVQRALVLARGDFGVGALRFGAAVVIEERDHVVQQRVVAMQPREIHVGQLERGDLLGANQLAEVAQRPERDVFEVRRTPHARRRAQADRLPRLVHRHARHERAEVERR